jgi:hypothetical protein
MTTPAGPGLRVYDAAAHLLDCVETAAFAQSVTLPAKRFVTSGTTPVHDCEQVVVLAGSVRSGIPGGSSVLQGNCPSIWSLVLSVQIVRCCPVPNAKGVVPVAKQDAHMRLVSADAEALMEASHNFAGFVDHEASIQLPSAQGGFGATTLNVVAGLA